MTHTVKLVTAVGLGVVAALLNWTIISQRTDPKKFAALTEDVEAGETITTNMIGAIEVDGPSASRMSTSVIPFSERAVLSGKVAMRDLTKDVLLMWDDFPVAGPRLALRDGEIAVSLDLTESPVASLAVGEVISFRFLPGGPGSDAQWVGPFRVVAVGEKTVLGERAERVEGVSVAVKENSSELQQLELYLDRQLKGEAETLQIRAHVSR